MTPQENKIIICKGYSTIHVMACRGTADLWASLLYSQVFISFPSPRVGMEVCHIIFRLELGSAGLSWGVAFVSGSWFLVFVKDLLGVTLNIYLSVCLYVCVCVSV